MREKLFGFKFGFGFGLGGKGKAEGDDSDSDSDDEGKKGGFKIGLPSFGGKGKKGLDASADADVPKADAHVKGPKISLPSFHLRFPSFNLDKSWSASFYGKGDFHAVPSGELAIHAHPSLGGLHAGLSIDGATEFKGLTGWKLRFDLPAGFGGVDLPELSISDHVSLWRKGGIEQGLSFDKHGSRHFFVLNAELPEIVFKIKLDGLSGVHFSKEKGCLSFDLAPGKPALVYTTPVAHLPDKKIGHPSVEWRAGSGELAIGFAGLAFPLALAFAISLQIPDPSMREKLFGFKFGFGLGGKAKDDGDSDSDDSDDAKKGFKIGLPSFGLKGDAGTPKAKGPKIALPQFSLRFPSFNLHKSWLASLFGKGDLHGVPHGEFAIHAHPSLGGLHSSLGFDGAAEFKASVGWSLRFELPSGFGGASAPELSMSDGLALWRNGSVEQGISFDKTGSRHFFIIGAQVPELVFKVKLDGIVSVNFNKEKGYITFDLPNGHPALIYTTPVAHLADKKVVSPNVEWRPTSGELVISLSGFAFPLALAFGVTLQVPSEGLRDKLFGFRFGLGIGGKTKGGDGSDSEDEDVKKGGFKLNFGTLGKGKRGDIGASGDLDVHAGKRGPKISLPTFNARFPSFNLEKSWLASLYGKGDHHGVLEGDLALHAHPSLGGLHASLALDGTAEFHNPSGWKLRFKLPSGFGGAATPELSMSDSLSLWRKGEIEQGLSFDKNGSRHFFVLGGNIGELVLKIELDGLGSVHVNKEKGHICFNLPSGSPGLVYTTPVAHLADKKVITPDVHWRAETGELVIGFGGASFPLAFTFGVSLTIPSDGLRDKLFGFKFGLNLSGKAHDDQSDSDDEGKKKAGAKGGFKMNLPSFGAKGKKGDIDIEGGSQPDLKASGKVGGGAKVSLPGFHLRFPSFSLDKSWLGSLFGKEGDFHAVPAGEFGLHIHPALGGLTAGLSHDGAAEFRGQAGWKLRFEIPLGLGGPSLPELNISDSLVLWRNGGIEQGLSFDKHGSRHFFVFGASLPELVLKLKFDGLTPHFNKEQGHLSFNLPNGQPALVYTTPIAHLSDKKVVTPTFEWRAESGELALGFAGLAFPLVLAFAVSLHIPTEGMREKLFGFKFGLGGKAKDDDSDDSDGEKKGLKIGLPGFGGKAKKDGKADADIHAQVPTAKGPKISMPAFHLRFPNFNLHKDWNASFYGKGGDFHGVPHGELALHAHPSLGGMHAGLSLDGTAEFRGAGGWKLHLEIPTGLGGASAPELSMSNSLSLWRNGNAEQGLSFDKEGSRHFFILGAQMPELVFKIRLDGLSGVQFDKEKGHIVFLLPNGQPGLVYTTPVAALPENKVVTPNIEWRAGSSELVVDFTGFAFPLALTFGVSLHAPDMSARHKLFGFKFGLGLPKIGGEVDEDVVIAGPSLAVDTISPKADGKIKVTALLNFGLEGKIIKEGYLKLNKDKTYRKRWTSKYFRVTATHVAYYKDERIQKQNNSFLLADACITHSNRKPAAFFIATPDRVYNLWPDSEKERDEWMTVINSLLRYKVSWDNPTPTAEIEAFVSRASRASATVTANVSLGASAGVSSDISPKSGSSGKGSIRGKKQ